MMMEGKLLLSRVEHGSETGEGRWDVMALHESIELRDHMQEKAAGNEEAYFGAN